MPAEVHRLPPLQMHCVVNHPGIRDALEEGAVIDLPGLAGTNGCAHSVC